MKRWKAAVAICSIAALACLALAGCSSQEYKPALKSQTVSASALGQSGTLRVGVDASHTPLAGKPKDGSSSDIMGIDVDVARYMADEMGLTVQIVDVGSDPDTAIKNKKVDVVLGVSSSLSSDTYWKSDQYMQTAIALFGTANESTIPTADSKPSIASKGSTDSSWRVSNLFGDSSLVSQKDWDSAFTALNSGTARYLAADAALGTYYINMKGYNDKMIALLENPTGYCVAVASSNTELQSAVASVVSKLTKAGVMDMIESQWLGAPLKLDSMTIVKSQYVSSSSSDSSSAKSDASASTENKTE